MVLGVAAVVGTAAALGGVAAASWARAPTPAANAGTRWEAEGEMLEEGGTPVGGSPTLGTTTEEGE